MIRARLHCTDALGAAQLIDISRGGVCGRDPAADIVLEHPTVSRRHARFDVRGHGVEISDLGSVNGTWVNGRPLDQRPCLLADGDQLRLGHLQLRFYLTPDDSTLPAPPEPPRGSLMQTQHGAGGRVEAHLLLARIAQRRMLMDRPPAIEGYEIGHVVLPCQGVGGDFLHWGRIVDGRHAVVVGDVCGKGVAAAMYMAFMSGLLYELVPASHSAADILARANAILHRVMEPGLFLTACACLIDPHTHRVEVASAGHAPPILRNADGLVREVIVDAGVALGAQSDADVGAAELQLGSGDLLLLTTDGVEEAHSAGGEEFGRARVMAALHAVVGAADAARRLQGAVARFTEGAEQHDDLTVIAWERCA